MWKIDGNFDDGKDCRLHLEETDREADGLYIFNDKEEAEKHRIVIEKIYQNQWEDKVFAKILNADENSKYIFNGVMI